MENDLKVELLKESLNKQKMNKINNIRPKEEEIKNNIEEFEINSNRFEETKEESIEWSCQFVYHTEYNTI